MAQSEPASVTMLRRLPPRSIAAVTPRVVTMAGEYDVTTISSLSARFSAAIALDGADLVVDLSRVSFLDGATTSVIVRAAGFLGEHGRSLLVRDPSPCARRLLGICELDRLIEIEVAGPASAASLALVPSSAAPLELTAERTLLASAEG